MHIRGNFRISPALSVVLFMVLFADSCVNFSQKGAMPASTNSPSKSDLTRVEIPLTAYQGLPVDSAARSEEMGGSSTSGAANLPYAPVFVIRSPVGRVQALEPENCLFGRPRRIEYSSRHFTLVGIKDRSVKVPSDHGLICFNQDGRVTEKGSWIGTELFAYRFQYDPQGRVWLSQLLRSENGVAPKIIYRYSRDKLLLTVEQVAAESGEIVGKEIQQLNANGLLISETIDRVHSVTRYEYRYDQSGRVMVIKRLVVDGDTFKSGRWRVSHMWGFETDNSGNVGKWTEATITDSRAISRTVRYSYDENGNVIGATYGEGKAARSTRFEYRFDEKGNWVNRRELPVGGLKTDKDRGYEIERTITYWE